MIRPLIFLSLSVLAVSYGVRERRGLGEFFGKMAEKAKDIGNDVVDTAKDVGNAVVEKTKEIVDSSDSDVQRKRRDLGDVKFDPEDEAIAFPKRRYVQEGRIDWFGDVFGDDDVYDDNTSEEPDKRKKRFITPEEILDETKILAEKAKDKLEEVFSRSKRKGSWEDSSEQYRKKRKADKEDKVNDEVILIESEEKNVLGKSWDWIKSTWGKITPW